MHEVFLDGPSRTLGSLIIVDPFAHFSTALWRPAAVQGLTPKNSNTLTYDGADTCSGAPIVSYCVFRLIREGAAA